MEHCAIGTRSLEQVQKEEQELERKIREERQKLLEEEQAQVERHRKALERLTSQRNGKGSIYPEKYA